MKTDRETDCDVPLPSAAQRVQAFLTDKGYPATAVRIMPDSTRTAADAAATLGIRPSNIAKSLIFRGAVSDRPILVIACGDNRVDEKKVAAMIGEKTARADADYVRARTGFAIGGVPPLAHAEPPIVLIDQDLLALGDIWAAAGTSRAVFPLRAADLPTLTGGQVGDVRKDQMA